MPRWTPEARMRQAERIRQWSPWSKSTGPRTVEGKNRSKTNAWKGGERPQAMQFTQIMRLLESATSKMKRHLEVNSSFGEKLPFACDTPDAVSLDNSGSSLPHEALCPPCQSTPCIVGQATRLSQGRPARAALPIATDSSGSSGHSLSGESPSMTGGSPILQASAVATNDRKNAITLPILHDTPKNHGQGGRESRFCYTRPGFAEQIRRSPKHSPLRIPASDATNPFPA